MAEATRPAVGAVSSRPAYQLAKRALDVIVSALALLVLLPVLCLIALMVRVDSSGSVLFRQARAGRNGEPFRLMKFRTMHAEKSAAGPEGTVHVDAPLEKDDPAITRVGKWLRASSLDELPQLVNVLRGNMSLVGPRPTIPEQAAAYGPREKRRLSVPQGLTGLAQVRGRNELSWPERIEIDLEYVERRSFLLDLSILARTPLVLLKRSGVYRGS